MCRGEDLVTNNFPTENFCNPDSSGSAVLRLSNPLSTLKYKSRNALHSDLIFYVPRRGLEPPWVTPLAPKASAYTNFATSAFTIDCN